MSSDAILTLTGGSGCPNPSPGNYTPQRDGSFVLTLTGSITQPLEVQLSWEGGTAVAGVDYKTQPTSVTFTLDTPAITLAAGITNTAAFKTIELNVVAGSGYTVGSPGNTTLNVAAPVPVIPVCTTPLPPSFTG